MGGILASLAMPVLGKMVAPETPEQAAARQAAQEQRVNAAFPDAASRAGFANMIKTDPRYAGKATTSAPISTAAGKAQAAAPGAGGAKPYTSALPPLNIDMPSMGGSSTGGMDFTSMLGGSFTPISTPDRALIAEYSTPSPEELANRQGVTDMARLLGGQGRNLYNVSSPTYTRAMGYYGNILSGNKAAVAQAIAPEAEMLTEMNAAEQSAIKNGSLRGGARDLALAESGRSGAGRVSALVPQARKDAAAAGSNLALQGMGLGTQQEGAAAGLYSNLAGMGQQDRQFGVQAEMQNRFQAAGLNVQEKQLQLQAMLGMRGLDLQQMGMALNAKLQARGLDLQEMMGMNSLNLQRELGLAGINLSQQQVDLLKQQMKNEASRASGAAWADMGNLLVTGLGMILPSGGGGGTQQLPINPLGAGLSTLAGN
jgi:hypothetical protein